MEKNKRVVKKIEKKFSLRKQYKLSFKFIRESKKYIYFGVFIFFLCVLIGLIYPKLFVPQILEIIKNLKSQTEGLNLGQLFGFILLNNAKASFLMLVLGIFFSIIPFANAIVNGYIVGFVSNYAIADYGILVLWKLVPHGIFELPALFISIGLGIKLGLYLFIRKKRDNFFEYLVNSLRVFVFVVLPLLIIAAIIESSLIYFLG